MNQMYSDLEKLERSAGEADRVIGIADQKVITIIYFRTEDGYNNRYLIEVSQTHNFFVL
jgi:hypothetical protein